MHYKAVVDWTVKGVEFLASQWPILPIFPCVSPEVFVQQSLRGSVCEVLGTVSGSRHAQCTGS